MREMKDSGVAWIGERPAEWEKNKIIRIFETIGSGTTPKANNEQDFDGEVYWIQSGDITGNYILTAKNKISRSTVEKYSALKVYAAPFIVVAMYGASIGNLAISNINACVNQACCVLKGSNIDFRFSYYTLQAAQNHLIQQGIGGGQPNISQEVIKQLWIPIPQQDEQERVSHFLDKKCAEIDAVLEKTRTSIEEYKKLKQAIITQAVTKGVRGDRPMKESGIEQIPKIPEDWDVVSLKKCIDILPGYAFSSQDFDSGDGIPLLRGINVGINEIRWENVVYWNKPLDDTLKVFRLEENDIVVGLDRPWIAGGIRVAFVQGDDLPCLLLQRVCRIRPDANIDRRLIFYWISSDIFKETLSNKTTGVSVPHISTKQIEQFIIAIPPNQEDRDICDYLDKRCKKIDSIIQKKEELLIGLEAFKKSLIYEYVTGKKEAPQA